MDYRTDFQRDLATWYFSGRLTALDNANFTVIVGQFSQVAAPIIHFDVAELRHMDSYGIGLILMARDEAGKLGKTFIVDGQKGEVEKLFRLSGLTLLFQAAPSKVVTLSKPPLPPLSGLVVRGPTREADADVFQVSGRFSFADYDSFAAVNTFLATRPKRVILDLEGLEFMDSGGLSMLLIAQEAAASTNTTLILRKARGRVARLFELAGLNGTLVIQD